MLILLAAFSKVPASANELLVGFIGGRVDQTTLAFQDFHGVAARLCKVPNQLISKWLPAELFQQHVLLVGSCFDGRLFIDGPAVQLHNLPHPFAAEHLLELAFVLLAILPEGAAHIILPNSSKRHRTSVRTLLYL